jgi:hypothetical protein
MPNTCKDKLALAFNALNDAKEDMTEDEVREMLNRRLQSAVPAKKRIMPTMVEVEKVDPEIYEEGENKAVPLPYYGEALRNITNLPAVEGGKAKQQTLPYRFRKKSKLYEMMQ